MTMTEQLLDNVGWRRNRLGWGRNRTARQLSRARKVAQRAGEDMVATIPPTYLWVGLGMVVATVALFMTDRVPRWGRRRVSDVMVRDVVTIDAGATLLEAAQMMRDQNIGVLPVIEGGRLRGLITDRDLVVRAMARSMDPGATPVRYVATEDLTCARPDWDVEEAMRVMGECQVGRLPVVDADGRVAGMVTLSSLALRSREEGDALHAAQEVSRRSARVA